MTAPTDAALPAIRKQPSIRDSVGRALRSAIISGAMQPGRVYSAPALSEQFGVSATPVREAMFDLIRDGLVVPLANRGFQVTEVSDRTLNEITDIRLMLEPPAIERATQAVPREELDRLGAVADEILGHAERGELVEYLTKDFDLHLALLRHAGNEQLVELVGTLRNRTRLYGLSRLAAEHRLADAAREHHAILAAIADRDAALARELTHRHIGHVRTDWAAAAPDGA